LSGAFNSRRVRRRPNINITSLIDVMFLLLIFFMVSSTFRDQIGIDVSLPQAGSAQSQQSDNFEVTVDREGIFFFGQQRVSDEGLRIALVQALEANPEAVITLRADKDAGFGRAIRAIDIAREVGGNRLVIPTEPMAEGAVP
jgi:biopolymer transport protein ExbD